MLTKLDRTRILVGFETVKYIEETPDTLIRFLNGESIFVRETLEEVLALSDPKRRQPAPQEAVQRHASLDSSQAPLAQ